VSTLNDTTDAMVWAEEFCRIFQGRLIITEDKPYGIGPGVDESTMVTWFANAIETGRAAGRKELCPHDNFSIDAEMMVCRDCGTLTHNQQ
jgi:hypothetical protein